LYDWFVLYSGVAYVGVVVLIDHANRSEPTVSCRRKKGCAHQNK
jgi:hypothetical protein